MKLNLAWRVFAVGLVVLYVTVTCVLLVLLLSNLGLAIIGGVTAAILAAAAWVVFTGSDRQRRWGIVVGTLAAIGLISEFIAFMADQRNRRGMLLLMLLTAVYIGLFAVLRRKYWTSKREFAQTGGQFQHPYLIINPKSGDGRAVKAHVDELAQQRGIQVIMTRKDVNVEELAREAVALGADVLGVSGGDGSIGAVAKVALEHDLPMVILPGGTRCHLARDLGLDPKEIVDSLAGFAGVERRIDAGEINGRIFLNNASFGLYADIVDHPEYREHKLQVSRNVLRQIMAGTKRPYALRFGKGGKSADHAVQVLVGVNRYGTLKVTELGHRERLDEGILHIIAITKLSNQLVAQLLRALSIDKINRNSQIPGLLQWTDGSFEICGPDDRIVVGVDGEREVYQNPVRVRVLPGALRVFVPAEGERARRKHPLSTAVVRKTWREALTHP